MSNTAEAKEQEVIIIRTPPKSKERRANGRQKGPRLLTILLSLLALIALVHILIVTHRADPVVPPADCTGLIRATDYTRAAHLQVQSQEMPAVEFVNQLDAGEPAALVQVMNNNPQHTLDVYVYGCTMQQRKPQLTVLFSQRGLVQGTVEVSQANTLITGELDTKLSGDASAFLLPLQQNVYREYAWQAGAFRRVIFPGLYPVTSRAEAEALQQEVDSGQVLPWTDPLSTAQGMAKDIFKWQSSSSQDAVISNDGITAQVQLIQDNPHLAINVRLQRLVQQDNKGLWFVVGAQTKGITLNMAGQEIDWSDSTAQVPGPSIPPLTSPVTLQGTGALADGQTSAALFDHTLTSLSSASSVLLHVNADGTYSGTLSYTNIALDQQGLLLIQSVPLPANNGVENGQLLLVRVILG